MKKYLYSLSGLMMIFAVFITTANAMENGNSNTDTGYSHRVTVLLVDDNVTIATATELGTVGELLTHLEIFLHDLDRVEPAVNTEIQAGMEIEIERAFEIYVKLDGSDVMQTAFARPGSSLLTLVNDLRNLTGLDYIFDMENWQKQIEPGEIVELTSIRRVTYEALETIPYENDYNENDEMMYGTSQVYRPGTAGMQQVNTLVTYIGGELISRSVVSTQSVAEPVNAVVHRGTQIPINHAVSACGEVFQYTRSFVAEATAYTLDFASTGRHPGDPLFGRTASGMMAQVGVVAVDTNVIPFHTRMYIEGYGFAVAGDRGGAIRGYKVDLFFDTRAETTAFGRQHLNVWILAEIDE